MAQVDPLASLFEKLDKFIRNDQHKKALKTAEEILAVAPGDADAKKVKVVAHMQLGEWEAALAEMNKAPTHGASAASQPAPSWAFEKAYCLYKLGRTAEGQAALAPLLKDSASEQGQAALELAAQMAYRQGEAQQTITLYDTLLKSQKVDTSELRANVLAAYISAGLSKDLPKLMSTLRVSADQAFEVGFNKACGLVEDGNWAAAELELRKAIKLGRETLLDEDVSDEEVEEELAPLTVQLAYVLGRQGRTADAQELYDTVLRSKSELADAPTRAVAINNSFADSGRVDGVAAHKKTLTGAARKLESLLADTNKPGTLTLSSELEARLSWEQKRLLALNRALIYVLSGRVEPARALATAVAKLEAEKKGAVLAAPALLPLLQASLLQRERKSAEADAVLQQCAASNPAAAADVTLARAQLALEGGDLTAAASLLGAASKALPGAPRGALVASQAALLTQSGDTQGLEQLLTSTLAALKGAGGGAGAVWCLESLVELQLRQARFTDAAVTYKALASADGAQSASSSSLLVRVLWGLAASGSTTPAVWSGLVSGLPSLAADVRGLNLDALETSLEVKASSVPVPASQKAELRDQQLPGAGDMDVDAPAGKSQEPATKRKRNKKRKRLPKGYDPSLPNGGLPPPDPERWLPKWQRSDAKKRKVKSSAREKAVGKGAQGAGKVDDALDRTKATVDASKAGPSKPNLPSRGKKGKK